MLDKGQEHKEKQDGETKKEYNARMKDVLETTHRLLEARDCYERIQMTEYQVGTFVENYIILRDEEKAAVMCGIEPYYGKIVIHSPRVLKKLGTEERKIIRRDNEKADRDFVVQMLKRRVLGKDDSGSMQALLRLAQLYNVGEYEDKVMKIKFDDTKVKKKKKEE